MNNVHSVFASKQEGFKYKIRPTKKDFDALNEAKKKVYAHLKSRIKQYFKKQHIDVSPKFRVQGSWAYGTCNAPAASGQEMDIDYGVYLPVSSFEGFDASTQSEQAKAYFEAVESMLKELCQTTNWRLDNSKSSCIRLQIQANAHMDVPLYAVPDSMFSAFKEKNEIQFAAFDSASTGSQRNVWFIQDYSDYAEFAEESLQEKNIQTIHMATREGSWKQSDCEIIRQWFADKLAEYPDDGQQLRDICRYLKAWRDWVYQSRGGAPSSILLMIIACKYYKYEQSRDDLALLSVLEELPIRLNEDVYATIEGHENEDFNRMDSAQRRYAKTLADNLYKYFLSSLSSLDKDKVVSFLVEQWGDRIPKDTNLITIDKDPFQGLPLVQSLITPQAPLRQG